MLEDESMAEFPIAVPSRGSSLFGATVSTKLDRQTLEQVILEGFFARTAIEDLPQKARRAGLQEFGLPYASDPVVSKHLARFLTRSLENVQSSETLRSLIGAQARSKPFLRRPQSSSTAASSRPLRSDGACSICWRRGMRARLFANCPVPARFGHGQGRITLRAQSHHGKGTSHQGRRVPILLYWPRDVDAGGARLQSASESALRRPAGDGGGL